MDEIICIFHGHEVRTEKSVTRISLTSRGLPSDAEHGTAVRLSASILPRNLYNSLKSIKEMSCGYTGETGGYPYLVCKGRLQVQVKHMYILLWCARKDF